MAHSVTSSTSVWLECRVQEEKCQKLKLKRFKKKGVRAYVLFYAHAYKFELYHKDDGKV